MDRFVLSLLLLVLLLGQDIFAQPLQYQFGRIDIAKGLSHQTVTDIYKDETGYMWFATASGLNRYDGYSIKVFRNIPGDSTSIASNEVKEDDSDIEIRIKGALDKYVRPAVEMDGGNISFVKFEEGKLTLEDLRQYALELGEPSVKSGKQEWLENIINRFI